MPSLLETTDIPMTIILEKCDFKSLLTLRKVCHSLRNFIDDSCFKTDLDDICITIDSNGFSVKCQNPETRWTDKISFAKDWTPNDLKIILKLFQNSKLSRFSVITNPDNVQGLDDLEEILKNQTRLLKTERFAMEGSEILKVLPYLDSKTLKNITIAPVDYKTLDENLDGIEQFLDLEQFKNAVELDISYGFLVRADLRKFFHFQSISGNLHETSLEELAFVTSIHMDFFGLNSRGLDGSQLEQIFGTPFHDDRYPLGYSQWFFVIQNCKEYVLRIEWGLGNLLRFRKWKAKDVPQDAVVHH
ncbi:unnamed protein product [Caenorhabditis brenneri]